MSDEEPYRVGYKRPPQEQKWKKGQSGNPRGRPPGHRNLAAAITAILNESVDVKVDGESRPVTKLEAAVRTLVDRSIKGDAHQLQQLFTEIHKNEAKAEQTAAAETLGPADKKVMDALYARLARDAVAKKKE
jgi:hypothetical protein